ncbi:MAG: PD-(D/E)XK nuclease family protein [Cyclobacteriaceae bacterium]|nr:PD-(D/E)XK nuclease family protein [Cyclobacteriaceae bacterium HetDA_MAG_MS6]
MTFVEEIAKELYEKHGDHLSELQVIFPNRRAGLFFRKALGQLISKPIWMPQVSSLEDFVLAKSSLRKLETLEAVFQLYEVYKRHQSKEESFDKFFFWGEMILRDFEEIDQYLVDPEKLFTSIKTQKELDEEFYFLGEDEKRIIQSFWATFLPTSTKSQEAFLETWKILLPIYLDFKQELLRKGQGYGGLIYREYLQGLNETSITDIGQLFFVGFNALTLAEEGIIKHFIELGKAEVYWDLDAYYMDDENQEAGFFLRQYRKDPILGKTFSNGFPAGITRSKPISTTGVSLEVGQAKAMAEDLQALSTKPDFQPERTVVVMPNEYMLFPALHSLSDEIDAVNITMGYPLKDAPVFSLVESVLQLQQTIREDLVNGVSFYHRPVIELLEHPLLLPLAKKKIGDLIHDIKRRNLIRLYQEELMVSHDLFMLIFNKPDHALKYLLDILKALHHEWKEKGHDLELEFISRFYQQIDRLGQMLGDRAERLSYDFLIKLFRRLARSLKIPFTGEPLQGLQVMGILETRNLDFDHVFILNMNENSWPAAPRKGSFIPYNIRKAFELPVYEHQDAIYSYLFYRLLHRAQDVHLYYNTVSEFNVNGELSRLVQQLAFESGLKIEKRILANPIKTKPARPIQVEKSKGVMEKLHRFLIRDEEWTPRLTPSALDTYLYCRLRFYFKYVEELYEPDEMQEEMDPMVFGNILHDTMEILYDQFMKKQKRDVIEPNDFFWLEGGVDGALNKAFVQHYRVKNEKKFKLEGRNIIAAEIIRKTALKILKFDQQYAPFKILGLETSTRDGYALDYPVEVHGKQLRIGLKGKIDRIDLKQGLIRVIDYKTGRDAKDFTTVSSLIDRADDKRNKAVFQVFFYSYLFYKTYDGEYDQIEPGLFNSRDLFDKSFDWRLMEKPGRKAAPVSEFRTYLEPFEEILTQLLHEIFDKEVAFDQVEDQKKCRWCPYQEICGRG